MGYPLTIHPEGRLAIVVAAGDRQTASDTGPQPRNRSPKGPATKRAINLNQQMFAGMELLPSVWSCARLGCFFFALTHLELRSRPKLSYPIGFNEDGYVTDGERGSFSWWAATRRASFLDGFAAADY